MFIGHETTFSPRRTACMIHNDIHEDHLDEQDKGITLQYFWQVSVVGEHKFGESTLLITTLFRLWFHTPCYFTRIGNSSGKLVLRFLKNLFRGHASSEPCFFKSFRLDSLRALICQKFKYSRLLSEQVHKTLSDETPPECAYDVTSVDQWGTHFYVTSVDQWGNVLRHFRFWVTPLFLFIISGSFVWASYENCIGLTSPYRTSAKPTRAYRTWIYVVLEPNPFIPKSDQCQISLVASPVILHHTVWRTWLVIAYPDERWLYFQFSLPHYVPLYGGWEDVLFELGDERVRRQPRRKSRAVTKRIPAVYPNDYGT